MPAVLVREGRVEEEVLEAAAALAREVEGRRGGAAEREELL